MKPVRLGCRRHRTLVAVVAAVVVAGLVVQPTPLTAAASTGSVAEAAVETLSVPGLDDVRDNLALPSSAPDGSAVSWTSSNPAVITPTGEVHRPPAGSAAARIALTAHIARNGTAAARTFISTVPAAQAPQKYEGYGFFYFTGEGSSNGEQVYAAASRGNDPLKWDEVNNGQPVLTSTLGEMGVRDPFIMRSPNGDRFYLLGTDLKIYGGRGWDAEQRTGSRSIMVWESDDLVHWSQQRSVQVAPPTAGNTWAPEAYWDAKRGDYVVFWASKLYAANDPAHTGDSYNRMLYATTRDFVTFSPAKVWIDPGHSVIDSTVLKDKDTYYRFTKDERDPSSSSPCAKFITEEKSTDLLDPNYAPVADCIGKATATSPGISAGEGPTAFKSNTEDKWYLFVDEFGGRGYVPFESTNPASGNWTMSTGAQLPASPRHGTVLPITKAEHDRLTAPPAPVKADKTGLVADWPLDSTTGTIARDATGHGYDGVLAGDTRWEDGALAFDGRNGHVQLPQNLLTGADAVTVSADVYVDSTQNTPYFLFGLGNTARDGTGDGYLFATGGTETSGFRSAIATGNWTTEQGAQSAVGLARGRWATVTVTVGNGSEVLYLDGTAVAHSDNVTITPSDIGNGSTAQNYLGRSDYAADQYFKGLMKNVRLYNRALTAPEVAALSSATIRSVRLPELKVPAVVDPAAGTVVLPVKPGTDLRHLAPTFVLAPGATLWPGNGRTVDLSRPARYLVTGSDGRIRVWTVSAHDVRTPVLPGYNADPNIAVFGDTYYIYGTTDGFPGWGGTTFSVWSSKNLVDWTDNGVILDLGRDVTWAHKSAWAPTIAERNGKYYFYFCAEAKIGVAVSDSPTGPFVDSGQPLIARNPDGSGQPIDPDVFVDDDGTPYLYWGNGNAFVVPLNADMVSFDPAKVVKLTGLDGFNEGSFMVKRKGIYYLSWSVDDTRSENYRVAYATATSPAGPFLNRGVILQRDLSLGIKGTGHSSMLRVPGTDDWYLAYHRFALEGGDGTHRETTLDRMRFAPDGRILPVEPTLEGVRPESVR